MTMKENFSGMKAWARRMRQQMAFHTNIEFFRPNRSQYSPATKAPMNRPKRPIEDRSALNQSLNKYYPMIYQQFLDLAFRWKAHINSECININGFFFQKYLRNQKIPKKSVFTWDFWDPARDNAAEKKYLLLDWDAKINSDPKVLWNFLVCVLLGWNLKNYTSRDLRKFNPEPTSVLILLKWTSLTFGTQLELVKLGFSNRMKISEFQR